MNLVTKKRGRGDDDDREHWKRPLPADRPFSYYDNNGNDDDEEAPPAKRKKTKSVKYVPKNDEKKDETGKKKTRRGTTHSQSQNRSATNRNTKANMKKRAPEAIAARAKLRHENDDSQALWTFKNQDGTRGFYFDHQSVRGVGAVRRSGDALVDPSGEKKAPTEPVTTSSNLVPLAHPCFLASTEPPPSSPRQPEPSIGDAGADPSGEETAPS